MAIAASARAFYRTRLWLVLATALLSVAAPASPPVDHLDHGSVAREDLRRMVKEGKLNTCVTDAVLSPAPNPVLLFQNHCDVLVNVTLCVRPAGEAKAYYMLLLRPQAEARHRLWMEKEQFEYKYNTCDKPHCSAPEPDC